MGKVRETPPPGRPAAGNTGVKLFLLDACDQLLPVPATAAPAPSGPSWQTGGGPSPRPPGTPVPGLVRGERPKYCVQQKGIQPAAPDWPRPDWSRKPSSVSSVTGSRSHGGRGLDSKAPAAPGGLADISASTRRRQSMITAVSVQQNQVGPAAHGLQHQRPAAGTGRSRR